MKTQISFAANLFGNAEEEHAGGALVFPSYDLGEDFSGDILVQRQGHSFQEMVSMYGAVMDVKPEGYAVDKKYTEIIYLPETVQFGPAQPDRVVGAQRRKAKHQVAAGQDLRAPVGLPGADGKTTGGAAFVAAGRHGLGRSIVPQALHGLGRRQILKVSKPITDAILTGPVFVADIKGDLDRVSELIHHDYAGRLADKEQRPSRPVLSPERSLGSVIKLLTPDSREYTPEYNAWLESVPQYLKELVFVVKRCYKPEWGDNWRDHFSVDIINGIPGNELKCDNRVLVTTRLRVGFEDDGAWRTFGLRKDFHPFAQNPNGGRHQRVHHRASGRHFQGRAGNGPDRAPGDQIREELRATSCSAATGRCDPSRL